MLLLKNEDHLKDLKIKMEEGSSLKFTYEKSVNNKIPFLDVQISLENGKYITSV